MILYNGSSIKAFATYLITQQLVPIQRATQIFKDILHIDVSPATLQSFMVDGYQRLETTTHAIEDEILDSAVVHADETGCDVNKDLWWIHSLSTLEYTWYFCDERRGKEAQNVVDLISRFEGRLVHDGWKTYMHYLCEHALCNAHHLRELVFVDEHLKEDWAKEMKKLLYEIKESVELACYKGKKRLSPKVERKYRARYRKILRKGYAIQPPIPERKPGQRGRLKQPPGKNLLDRLKIHIREVLAFMYDFSVPFTNNLAERDLRMVKVKLKISGCFRTAFGAQIFCRIRGFISTLRKQNLNILEYLQKMYNPELAGFNLLDV